jgi:octaprenyl-diphosphate synthase
MHFDLIQQPVKEELLAVDQLMIQCLNSRASLINEVGSYTLQSGGKRLRPLVVLLIAKACGYNGTHATLLAVVIEFIHTATLLHDDVVDESTIRRGQKTANVLWGNQAAILVGDFLYSRAFELLLKINNEKIMKVIIHTTNQMAEGEALQLLQRHNLNLQENDYLHAVRCKTAKLFEAAAQCAAILGQASSDVEQCVIAFGSHLGTAFQLIDDVLDYNASLSQMGKEPGNDLAEGKVTLPMIHALQQSTPTEAAIIQQSIKSHHPDSLANVLEILQTRGGITYTKNLAGSEITKAIQALSQLPPSPYKDAASYLAEFAVNREH